MAISFVGSAENSASGGANVTLTLPSMQENDLVVVAYAIGDNDNTDFVMAMVTAGYTKVADLHISGTQDVDLGVFWKKMGASPDASAEVDGQGGADAAVAAVAMVFRGVDPTTPMDVTPAGTFGLITMHPNPLSLTHNNPAGVWTVIVGASGHTRGGAGTYTFPTGYTVNALERGADDASDVTVGMGYRTDPANPEDPGVMTHSGADSIGFSWDAVTLALRPKVTAFTLGADAGVYTVAGIAAGLRAGRRLTALPGSFAWTGVAVDFVLVRPPRDPFLTIFRTRRR